MSWKGQKGRGETKQTLSGARRAALSRTLTPPAPCYRPAEEKMRRAQLQLPCFFSSIPLMSSALSYKELLPELCPLPGRCQLPRRPQLKPATSRKPSLISLAKTNHFVFRSSPLLHTLKKKHSSLFIMSCIYVILFYFLNIYSFTHNEIMV